ncbi:MAG TPA: GntG family PLP-dependent aldolase [Flavitalea sp.]|nr:GntG family PLP-dependent aldolase [Flavitalea sp.]
MIVELRSDTFTKPSAGMLAAMASAETGDDVFGEDPSINKLENMTAELFGMQSALYCPTGTMSNQVAIKVHTQPGDEVICDKSAHVFLYEGGGIAFNSGAQVRLLEGNRGQINATQVSEAVNNRNDVHKANSSLVCLENTCNRGGGSCYELHEIAAIRQVCDANELKLHLDGARLFNALVATGQKATEFGRLFNSISLCLNKGLGCPMGSMLVGTKEFIRKARRVRKVLGGGMRQAGYMAACGIYALENNIQRLAMDHEHAKRIANALQGASYVARVHPVDTNIIVFDVTTGIPAESIAKKFENENIRVMAIAPTQIRMVTHLDVSSEMVDYVVNFIDAHKK